MGFNQVIHCQPLLGGSIVPSTLKLSVTHMNAAYTIDKYITFNHPYKRNKASPTHNITFCTFTNKERDLVLWTRFPRLISKLHSQDSNFLIPSCQLQLLRILSQHSVSQNSRWLRNIVSTQNVHNFPSSVNFRANPLRMIYCVKAIALKFLFL